MSIILSAIKIIFLLGFLIGIHETGHFLMAKLCKVKVNEFAIGFGPVIWNKQGKETKYALRLIPLGGFVSMEGEEQSSDDERSFSKASILKRILICAAGATVNIIFAIIIYFILSSSQIMNSSNIVKDLTDGFAAKEAGIQVGDEILEINNKKIITNKEINEIVSNSNEVIVKIKRNNEIKEIKVKPTEMKYSSTGIYLPSLDEKSTKIVAVAPNSTAEKNNIKAGDTVVKINDTYVKDDLNILLDVLKNEEELNRENIKNNKEVKLKILIERNNKEIEVELIPDILSKYYLGVVLDIPENNLSNKLYYGVYNTKEFIEEMFVNIKNLFTGKVSTAQLVGPIGISEAVAKTNGFKDFINMMALISMSLGITNLLPFPPLDGGKILFLIIEAIRRKPLKQETEIKIQLLGFAFLIGLSIIVTYNDILRIF